MIFCKWIYFLYANGFGPQKLPYLTPCFQYVDGFGLFVDERTANSYDELAVMAASGQHNLSRP